MERVAVTRTRVGLARRPGVAGMTKVATAVTMATGVTAIAIAGSIFKENHYELLDQLRRFDSATYVSLAKFWVFSFVIVFAVIYRRR